MLRNVYACQNRACLSEHKSDLYVHTLCTPTAAARPVLHQAVGEAMESSSSSSPCPRCVAEIRLPHSSLPLPLLSFTCTALCSIQLWARSLRLFCAGAGLMLTWELFSIFLKHKNPLFPLPLSALFNSRSFIVWNGCQFLVTPLRRSARFGDATNECSD